MEDAGDVSVVGDLGRRVRWFRSEVQFAARGGGSGGDHGASGEEVAERILEVSAPRGFAVVIGAVLVVEGAAVEQGARAIE